MDTDTLMDVYGIVVGKKVPNCQYYVWCKESESDLFLQMDRTKPVKLGTWVNMRFRRSEYQNPNFLIHDYVVVTPIYKTEVEGNTVRLQLEQYLNSNLKELDNWFFGKIHNNRNKEFPTGFYYLTIKKIRKESGDIWVMENVDASEPKKTTISGIIGIVSGSGKKAENQYFVWCKERKADYDVVIFSENPNIKIGTWLKLDLSLDQLSQPYLECSNFTVIQYPIHPTFLSENSQLCLNLEIWVPEGSQNVSHPFVGEIINIIEPFGQSGRYSITAMRNKIGSQIGWFLKAKKLSRVRFQSANVEITGIVVAQDANVFYVWCRERLPGLDIAIPKSASLSLTDWIQFSISREELDHSFPSDPKFQIREFRRITAQFQTDLSVSGKSVTVKINMEIARNPRIENIHHDFMGLIINERFEFQQSGMYSIIIHRAKKGENPRSVWYIQNAELQSSNVEITGIVVAQDPKNFYVWCRERIPGLDIAIPKPASLSLTDWIQFSVSQDLMENFFKSDQAFQIEAFRRIPSILPTGLSKNGKSVTIKFDMEIERNLRVEDIHHDVMGLIINEKFEFQQSGRYSITIYRAKKEENPRSVWYIQNVEMAPPTPKPRSSPISPSAEERYFTAMIMNISNFEHNETINVWIFDLKQQGTLKLNVATEKLNLNAGDMFEAVFSNINETWFSTGPVTKMENSYTRRPNNNSNQVEILVDGKSLNDADSSHRCSWIDHGDFGDILDINDLVQNHENLVYKVWIQRALVNNNYQWIV
ncbi:hypothetical protein B9Z55_023192 [Caenorhabditis nigoni]|uniref:Uncharacterized protein n=2 Tax=Caenorhabditis nigoni TaxID=1611254 RepID=A0A2G5SNZ9_9PELO|nr:hypothetical protein B9Z55_023192 [Caenorhabditis nigoni]